MSDINTVAEDVLLEIGGNPANKGFMYIVSAMETIDGNPEIQYCVTKLYETIGKQYSVNPINVERCIRYAKEEILSKGTLEDLNKYFMFASEKCYNGKFLVTLYLKINQKMRGMENAD